MARLSRAIRKTTEIQTNQDDSKVEIKDRLLVFNNDEGRPILACDAMGFSSQGTPERTRIWVMIGRATVNASLPCFLCRKQTIHLESALAIFALISASADAAATSRAAAIW